MSTLINTPNDAREGNRNAAAYGPQVAHVSPPVCTLKEAGAAPVPGNAAYFNDVPEHEYVRIAERMGYRMLRGGNWHHVRMGFNVSCVRRDWLRLDRHHTLLALRDQLELHKAKARGARVIAGLVTAFVLAALMLMLTLWPGRAGATARDELLRINLADGFTCTGAYTLPAWGVGTLTCTHGYIRREVRAYPRSGNTNVLASVAVTDSVRHAPFVTITLFNATPVPQSGTAVVRILAP